MEMDEIILHNAQALEFGTRGRIRNVGKALILRKMSAETKLKRIIYYLRLCLKEIQNNEDQEIITECTETIYD